MYEIRAYETRDGKSPYFAWLLKLRDSGARVAIARRIGRVRQGNFGDRKACGEGVWELRIDTGPGYRIYYVLDGKQIVLLLCGGDKSTQPADIKKSIDCWLDWKARTDERQKL